MFEGYFEANIHVGKLSGYLWDIVYIWDIWVVTCELFEWLPVRYLSSYLWDVWVVTCEIFMLELLFYLLDFNNLRKMLKGQDSVSLCLNSPNNNQWIITKHGFFYKKVS